MNLHAHSVQGGFLACTLLFLLFVAAVLTCSTLGTLVAGRLIFYMRVHGLRDGLASWMQEMRDHLLSSAEVPAEETADILIKSEQNKPQEEYEHASDLGSAVVVERVADDEKPEAVKVE